MLFVELASASQAVAATSRRNEKVAVLAGVLVRLGPGEVEPAVAFLTGTTLRGRLGVGWSTVRGLDLAPATHPTLTIAEVDHAVAALASIAGTGSVARRRDVLADLFGRATEVEHVLLRAIVGGELRQGALDGVLASAIAKAAAVPVDDVRRAAMFSGSLPAAARTALVDGAVALAGIGLVPARPVHPMLAATSATVAEALGHTGLASVEWKLDGARIQAHRSGDEVRLFTRNLNDVTDRLDGVVDLVRSLPGGDLVLDGEVLGVDDTGAPRRFQDTMGDFGADAGDRGGGLRAFFFDALNVDGSLVDEPLAVRREVLVSTVPEGARLASIVTDDPAEGEAFLDRAVASGHEGVVVKRLDAPYEAGRRGGSWRKVKPVHTLDLVVLAVEWGHGRRAGWLSNLHLGARGGPGEFVMVGKTFKGLTDELLAWQTERFLALRLPGDSDAYVVNVRPEQVVEVAVDGVQVSRRYPGGVALRFARVRRYRNDKSAADADPIERVQGLLR